MSQTHSRQRKNLILTSGLLLTSLLTTLLTTQAHAADREDVAAGVLLGAVVGYSLADHHAPHAKVSYREGGYHHYNPGKYRSAVCDDRHKHHHAHTPAYRYHQHWKQAQKHGWAHQPGYHNGKGKPHSGYKNGGYSQHDNYHAGKSYDHGGKSHGGKNYGNGDKFSFNRY